MTLLSADRRDWSLQDAATVASAVHSDPSRGLSPAEVATRRQRHGRNVLRAAPPVPTWRVLLAQFQDPLVYLLVAAVVVSGAAWLFEGTTGVPVDALVITGVIMANALIGFVQETRAAAAVEALQKLTEVVSTVLRDGEVGEVPSVDLVPGDVLLLAEGDSIGADARLLEVASLRVAESSLTGESQPVTKDAVPLPEPVPLGDRSNMVFKGTAVTQGTGRAVVTSTGMATEVGAIAALLESTPEEPTPLEVEIARVGRTLGTAVVVVAVVVMVTVWLVNGVHTTADAVTVLLLGVSLAVAAVPEGLPAILSVVLSIGVQRLANDDAIVKKLRSVETLGSASVICSDKTGTLTRNEMTLTRVVTASGVAEVTGVGYAPDGTVEPHLTSDDSDQMRETTVVLSGGSLASNAVLQKQDDQWQIMGDPTEGAFLVAERKLGVTPARDARFTRIAEVPFTSERKLMSTLQVDHDDADRLVLVSKGAAGVVLDLCTHERSGPRVVPLSAAARERILGHVEAMSADALRTLAVAYRPVQEEEVRPAGLGAEATSAVPSEVAAGLEHDLVYVGTVGIIDPARSEAAVAIQEAHRAGIRVVMITGDHPATALRIAQDLGVARDGENALTGVELERLDDAGLREAVASVSVYARVAPEHKLRIVDALRAGGNIVAMTGDGVNDAPALKTADIGVAMGVTGTEVTKEAAAMILGDDNFATIVVAVRQGRVIFDNIKKFLRYLLSSNMGEVLTVFGGVVLAGVIGLDAASGASVVLPLLATQILWVNLVTDSAPALAMGVDPETDDVMARPPRRLDDRVIDGRMWAGVVMIGLVIAVATLLTIDLFLPGGLLPGHDSLVVARTCGFTTLVLAQLFNAFNSRSETTSAFHRMFVNPWLWGSVVFGVLAQVLVVEAPFFQTAFGTASLDLRHWLVSTAMASSVLWFDEARKLVSRRSRAPA